MLDSAAELFGTQGYHASGLNQLVSAGGAPKGSLYFHFPGGKEQLAAEALQASGERLGETLAALMAAAEGPGDAVDAMVQVFAQNLVDSDFRRGCPLATVALDAAAESEPIRNACVQGYRGWQDLIEEYLAGRGLPPARAAELATVVLTAVEGALLLAKTRRDTAPLYTVGAHLRATLERELA